MRRVENYFRKCSKNFVRPKLWKLWPICCDFTRQGRINLMRFPDFFTRFFFFLDKSTSAGLVWRKIWRHFRIATTPDTGEGGWFTPKYLSHAGHKRWNLHHIKVVLKNFLVYRFWWCKLNPPLSGLSNYSCKQLCTILITAESISKHVSRWQFLYTINVIVVVVDVNTSDIIISLINALLMYFSEMMYVWIKIILNLSQH